MKGLLPEERAAEQKSADLYTKMGHQEHMNCLPKLPEDQLTDKPKDQTVGRSQEEFRLTMSRAGYSAGFTQLDEQRNKFNASMILQIILHLWGAAGTGVTASGSDLHMFVLDLSGIELSSGQPLWCCFRYTTKTLGVTHQYVSAC